MTEKEKAWEEFCIEVKGRIGSVGYKNIFLAGYKAGLLRAAEIAEDKDDKIEISRADDGEIVTTCYFCSKKTAEAIRKETEEL